MKVNKTSVAFHLRNYFNLNLTMTRQPYIFITILHVMIIIPYMLNIISEEAAASLFQGQRLELSQRLAIYIHSLLLLPAYIKRLKDVRATKKHIDLALIALYAPNFLGTFLSDAAFELLQAPISTISLAGIIITIMLLAIKKPTSK